MKCKEWKNMNENGPNICRRATDSWLQKKKYIWGFELWCALKKITLLPARVFSLQLKNNSGALTFSIYFIFRKSSEQYAVAQFNFECLFAIISYIFMIMKKFTEAKFVNSLNNKVQTTSDYFVFRNHLVMLWNTFPWISRTSLCNMNCFELT